MTQEQIEMLQDAWFLLRDALEESLDAKIAPIMTELHQLIDDELGCDTMEQGDALEEKEDNTMKKYTVKAEYADQIFGGECDTEYVEECMQNGMQEEDVMHLVREFGEAVLDQFDIEEV